MHKTEFGKVTDASPTYFEPALTHSDQYKIEWTSAAMTKFVKLRSAEKDRNDELYRVVLMNQAQNIHDISIPMNPENVLIQELYDSVHAESPHRIIFRYIGTDHISGETCRNFGHYNRVKCADFTRKFTNIRCVFQILSQLPAVQVLQIWVHHENLILTEEEAAQSLKKYKCPTLKRLEIIIDNWDNADLVDFKQLRLNDILKYTKLCCPNLKAIYVRRDENQPTTTYSKTLKRFREALHDEFGNISISWNTTKNNQPASNTTSTCGNEKTKRIASVTENRDDLTQNKYSHKLPTSIASPNISGRYSEEKDIKPPVRFPIHSVADMEDKEEFVVFDHSEGGQSEPTSATVESDPTSFNWNKRTPLLQEYNRDATYKIPVTPGRNCFGNGRGIGKYRKKYTNYPYSKHDRRKSKWRS